MILFRSRALIVFILFISLLASSFMTYNLSLNHEQQIIDQLSLSAQIIHIDYINNREAVALYTHSFGDNIHLAHTFFKRSLFGWRLLGGTSSANSQYHALTYSFSDISRFSNDYVTIGHGHINNGEIVAVKVVTTDGDLLDAAIIESGNYQRYWYVISRDQLMTRKLIAYNNNNEVIFEF